MHLRRRQDKDEHTALRSGSQVQPQAWAEDSHPKAGPIGKVKIKGSLH